MSRNNTAKSGKCEKCIKVAGHKTKVMAQGFFNNSQPHTFVQMVIL